MLATVGTATFLAAQLLTAGDALKLSNAKAPLPVVMWHGMGDNCCNHMSMVAIEKMIQGALGENLYVHSIMIGNTPEEDTTAGFFTNVNEQVRQVCEQLKADARLKGGFNAIGWSQGSQFMRAYIERCNEPKVHNFISMGGQHQGVFGLPHCKASSFICAQVVQEKLVQAEYWHDPNREDEYREKNIFLPDINNDKETKNSTYKRNLMSLNKFVMVKFEQDGMVVPIESEWFGWYKPGSDKDTVPLQETQLYKEDWLGLREMDKKGQLVFVALAGDHLQFTDQWFIDNIVNKYLR